LNSFEEKGFWWIPNDKENRVAGVLKFDPEKGIKLELFDSLNVQNSRLTRFGERIPYEDVILGLTSKNVTLYQCYQINSAFDVGVIFHNHHFENVEDIEFDRINITYPNLDTWVGKSGLVLIEKELEMGLKDQLFGYKPPNEIYAKIKNIEIQISFQFLPLPNPPSEIRLMQRIFIELKTDIKTHFDLFNDKILHLLYQFLTLAIGRAVYPLSINGYNNSFKYKVLGKEINPEINIFHERKRFRHMGKIRKQEMLFSFSDISDNFEKYLNNWFEKAEDLEWVYNLYTATILAKSMLIEHKFLSLAQALESYHQRVYKGKYLTKGKYRKIKRELLLNIPKNIPNDLEQNLRDRIIYGNAYSFNSRLTEIYENYSEILDLVIDDKETFVEDVINTRNFFTHFSNSLEKKAKSDDELVNLTDQIRCILEVCLLAELGMSLNKIKDIIMRNKRYKYFKN
jgi:hypothetical protein